MKKIFKIASLLMISLVISGCSLFNFNKKSEDNSSNSKKAPEGYALVHFDRQTELETNVIEDQTVKIGSFAKEPYLVCPKNLNAKVKVSGWYEESSFVHKWDFTANPVTKDMTLYAKWVDMISISYYLKGSTSPIWVVNNASRGDPLEQHDELCDGYEFYGYFQDKGCTIPFDLTAPLQEDTTVYMYRGETLHLNAHSIKRRFTMIAAGGPGSTAGNISDVKLDPSGVSCVDVNFGYSTSADPYMLITNPQIDISKSQKLRIKFKNFGASTNLSFYWVSQYKDGSYAGNVRNDTESNSAHYQLNGFECYMTEDDPWIEREFDLSEKFTNGISTWANSTTLVRLRIQFGYVSRNIHDTSNIIRIASIDAVTDTTNVGFNDSTAIKNMLVNDSESELIAASDAQTQQTGVVFPKNRAKITNASSNYYVKKEGLLLYAEYGSDISRYYFDVSDQNIDAANYSYLSIKLRNYSYISSMNVYINTLDENTGKTVSNVMAAPLAIRMSKFGTINLNFYSKANMKGIIQSFSLLFNYNGVDNAILLENMVIAENKSLQLPGFNFNDPLKAGFVSNEDVTVSLNKSQSTSKFVSTKASSTISYNLDYDLDITPYSFMEFSYYKLVAGITSVTVSIQINDLWKAYPVTLGDVSGEQVKARFNLLDAGLIQGVKFEFTGIGELEISAIEFILDESVSWDISDPNVFNRMLDDWRDPIAYVEDQRAALFTSGNENMRYYFGFLYDAELRNYGNICLEGKSSIYLIYKNLNSFGTPFINAYAVDSTEQDDYSTGYNERAAFISGQTFNIEKDMNDRSWKVAKINIPSGYQKSNYYLSNFAFGSLNGEPLEFYIRGIVVK